MGCCERESNLCITIHWDLPYSEIWLSKKSHSCLTPPSKAQINFMPQGIEKLISYNLSWFDTYVPNWQGKTTIVAHLQTKPWSKMHHGLNLLGQNGKYPPPTEPWWLFLYSKEQNLVPVLLEQTWKNYQVLNLLLSLEMRSAWLCGDTTIKRSDMYYCMLE